MRKYVIMGVQGSGKGTQSEMLAGDLDLVHISVGDIFRWNVLNHTKMGAQVQRIINGGELVGDDVAESVVQRRLAEHDWNYGFLIDGFPRSARQAEFFMESYDIDAVIYLDLPDSEVRRRVLNRRLCAECGMDYNLIGDSPREAGRCDSCGGELTTRDDDTEEALAVRLREYHEKTNPVLELFRRKELVITVDARADRDAVQQEIRSKLGLPPFVAPDAGSSETEGVSERGDCDLRRERASGAGRRDLLGPRRAAQPGARRPGSPTTASRCSSRRTAGSVTCTSSSRWCRRCRRTWSSCC